MSAAKTISRIVVVVVLAQGFRWIFHEIRMAPHDASSEFKAAIEKPEVKEAYKEYGISVSEPVAVRENGGVHGSFVANGQRATFEQKGNVQTVRNANGSWTTFTRVGASITMRTSDGVACAGPADNGGNIDSARAMCRLDGAPNEVPMIQLIELARKAQSAP